MKIIIRVDEEIKEAAVKYLEKRESDEEKITTMLAAGDYEGIRVAGHRIKGSGGMYGFIKISEIGATIETAAETHDDSAIRINATAISEYVKNVEVISGGNNEI